MRADQSGAAPSAEDVVKTTPHNKALYEAGKAILIESVSVGREFCKFMITTAVGALPVYLALLRLALPKGLVLTATDKGLFLVAPVMFLLAAILFTMGYFPVDSQIALDVPHEIEAQRNRVIRRRRRFALSGSIAFALGLVVAACLVVSSLGPGDLAAQ